MPKLVYFPKSKRWHVYEGEHYCCRLRRGDPICIRVQDRYLSATVEFDTMRCLLIDGVKFYFHPEQRYDAILMF